MTSTKVSILGLKRPKTHVNLDLELTLALHQRQDHTWETFKVPGIAQLVRVKLN